MQILHKNKARPKPKFGVHHLDTIQDGFEGGHVRIKSFAKVSILDLDCYPLASIGFCHEHLSKTCSSDGLGVKFAKYGWGNNNVLMY